MNEKYNFFLNFWSLPVEPSDKDIDCEGCAIAVLKLKLFHATYLFSESNKK